MFISPFLEPSIPPSRRGCLQCHCSLPHADYYCMASLAQSSRFCRWKPHSIVDSMSHCAPRHHRHGHNLAAGSGPTLRPSQARSSPQRPRLLHHPKPKAPDSSPTSDVQPQHPSPLKATAGMLTGIEPRKRSHKTVTSHMLPRVETP